MKPSKHWLLALTVGLAAIAASAFAQRGRPVRPAGGATPPGNVNDPNSRVITIPVVEACAMAQRMRVWLVHPPAGASAYGLGSLGEGTRIWAVLPSCRQPDPDDPRDPCPVGRVAIEPIGGGTVASGEPQTVTPDANARRVQSFVIPPTVRSVRVRLLRRDDGVRWEAAVDVGGFANLPPPAGSPTPNGFSFDFSQYPSR